MGSVGKRAEKVLHNMRIHGTGPIPNALMIMADYPGRKEHELGVSLVGKTGDEVTRRLNGDRLPRRSDWYITTLIKEWRPENEYPASDVVRDEPELLEEIADVKPSVIVTLGRTSARWCLGDVALDEVNALPWYATRPELGNETVVVPLYNPAAGFRSPEVQSQVDYGFAQLALYFDGVLTPRHLFEDSYPSPTYLEIADSKWIASLQGVTTIYIDTEGYPDCIWSLQFCVTPGTAYMIRSTDTKTMRAFFDWLTTERPRVVYHGSLHDFSIMRSLMTQLNVPVTLLYDIEFEDTQIMNYVLQLEPLGLKPSCVRHCGMSMKSYEEVLGNAQLIHATDYLVRLFDAEHAEWSARCQREFRRIKNTPLRDKQGAVRRTKDGAVRTHKISKVPQLPKSAVHKAAERVLRSTRPFELWQEQTEDIRVAAYNRMVS